jgi:hypothetical protein
VIGRVGGMRRRRRRAVQEVCIERERERARKKGTKKGAKKGERKAICGIYLSSFISFWPFLLSGAYHNLL